MTEEKDLSRPIYGSIRRRLMLWGLVLLGSALMLNTIAGSIYTRHQIRQASAKLQKEMASLTARRIRSFIERKLERLQDAATAMSLHPLGGQEQKLLGLLLVKNDPSFIEFSIVDHQGMELLKSSERTVYLTSEFQKKSASAAFLKAIGGDFYVSPVRTSDHAEPYVTLAVPLWAGSQKPIGALIAEANLKFLWDVVGESTFGSDAYAYVIDERGKVIAHRDASLVLKGLNVESLSKIRRFLSTRSEDPMPGEEGLGISGKQVLSTYAPVPELGWAVVVEEPVELALADLDRLHRYAFLLVGVGLLVGAGIIVWASRKITRPIQELREGAEIIGAGNLKHRANIKTGDEIEELADAFNKMTEALQNSYATLEQKVEQRTREMSALYEVTTAVNESLDVQSILDAVIAKTTEIFHFQATRVFLFNEALDALEIRASFEAVPKYFRGTRSFRRGQGVVGRVADSGEPLIFEDIWTDSRYAAFSKTKAMQIAERHFFAAFPIKNQSHVVGVITFNGEAPRKLTTDEIRLLTSMAEHLGVAIEKANLFGQVQSRSQHLAVLNTIGAAVSHSLDLDVILQEAVEKIIETFSFDACWIYILDPSEQHLRLKAHKGFNTETAQSMDRRPIMGGISGKIFETRLPMVFDDLQNDPHYQQISSRNRVTSLGFRSAAGFPIKAGNKINGTLHVANHVRHHFASDHLQLLESIAHTVGVAVENARLFAEVKEKTSELEKANRELVEATQAKSEFIAAMSHELRTPLHIIIGHSDLTRDGTFGAVSDQQQTVMRKISRNARVLLKMINDVLTLSRIEAKKMSLDIETVEIKDVLEQAQTHVEQINRDNHVEVSWHIDENIPPVVTDPIKLEEILQNLIGNAFKFTPNGRIDVGVRELQDRGRVEFSVADTGIGIEAHNLGKIFEDFEQVKGSNSGNNGGVGLGLSIVKKYLDLMQGEIQVESKPGQGSKFTFSIPRLVSLHS
jgi:signal transduction histidine kinase